MNFSSYAGFYNGNYLRSSYEYVFARILEKQGIIYDVEVETFLLPNGKSFKPDFFLYNENNKLVRIVEVKSENKKRVKESQEKIELLQKMMDVQIELVQSKELIIMCDKVDLNFYQLKNEWIDSDKTTKNHVLSGEFNPMHGRKQTVKSKKLNGAKTKERFKDDTFRKKHSNAVKIAMVKVDRYLLTKGKIKDREVRECEYCNEKFTVIITSNQRFCSNLCGSRGMFKLASEVKKSRNEIKSKEIREDVIQWAMDNKEYLNDIPLYGCSKLLKQSLEEFLIKHNLKDFRNIFFAFYGNYKTQYQKFLIDLKNIVNEVR